MAKLQLSSLLTAAVLGLVFFNPGYALEIAAIRPNELTHPASTPSFMAQASAAQYLEQGIQLGQVGDDRGAEAAFRKAVQLDPNNAAAHANLGVALANQSKREEAISEFRQALRLNPNNSMAHNNLGTVLGEQGKLAEAIAEFRQALRLNPNDAVAHMNLGIVLYKQGQRAEAITEYRQALRLNPNYAEAHMNLGVVLLQQGKREEAIAEFKQARELFKVQGKTQEATQIDQGIQKINAQDTNSLSSQGFSLRIKHSPQVNIQNSVLVLLPANISNSRIEEVLKTVVFHKTVNEIERLARGSEIKVVSAKDDNLHFPTTTLSSAKLLLAFDFSPDSSNKECQDYRIEAVSSIPDEIRTYSNAHPHAKDKCRFIASSGFLKPIPLNANGLTNVLFSLHAGAESLIPKEPTSKTLQVLTGEIIIPAEVTFRKGFVRLVLPSKDTNTSTIPFSFLAGSSEFDVDLDGNFIQTSPLQPTTYLEANVEPDGHFVFQGVHPGNYQMVVYLVVSSTRKDCSSISKHYDIWDLDPNPNTHRDALSSYRSGLPPDGNTYTIWSYFIKPLVVNSATKTAGSFKLTCDFQRSV